MGAMCRVAAGHREVLPQRLPEALRDIIERCWAHSSADRCEMQGTWHLAPGLVPVAFMAALGYMGAFNTHRRIGTLMPQVCTCCALLACAIDSGTPACTHTRRPSFTEIRKELQQLLLSGALEHKAIKAAQAARGGSGACCTACTVS